MRTAFSPTTGRASGTNPSNSALWRASSKSLFSINHSVTRPPVSERCVSESLAKRGMWFSAWIWLNVQDLEAMGLLAYNDGSDMERQVCRTSTTPPAYLAPPQGPFDVNSGRTKRSLCAIPLSPCRRSQGTHHKQPFPREQDVRERKSQLENLQGQGYQPLRQRQKLISMRRTDLSLIVELRAAACMLNTTISLDHVYIHRTFSPSVYRRSLSTGSGFGEMRLLLREQVVFDHHWGCYRENGRLSELDNTASGNSRMDLF